MFRPTIVVLGIVFALASASAIAQQRLYKCKDDKGKFAKCGMPGSKPV